MRFGNIRLLQFSGCMGKRGGLHSSKYTQLSGTDINRDYTQNAGESGFGDEGGDGGGCVGAGIGFSSGRRVGMRVYA